MVHQSLSLKWIFRTLAATGKSQSPCFAFLSFSVRDLGCNAWAAHPCGRLGAGACFVRCGDRFMGATFLLPTTTTMSHGPLFRVQTNHCLCAASTNHTDLQHLHRIHGPELEGPDHVHVPYHPRFPSLCPPIKTGAMLAAVEYHGGGIGGQGFHLESRKAQGWAPVLGGAQTTRPVHPILPPSLPPTPPLTPSLPLWRR